MKRVVITGLGAITPIGNNVASFWQNLKAGNSGAAPIQKFDASNFRTGFACEVKGYDPLEHFTKQDLRKYDLYTQYGLIAAEEAVKDAGIEFADEHLPRYGVIWGSGNGGITTLQNGISEYATNPELPRFNPYFMPMVLSNMASGIIAMKYGLQGITFTAVSACASANTAFMEALNYIRWDKADMMIVGSSDAPVIDNVVGGFNAMRALSRRNDAPEKASRPFDVDRDGFVLGEGAGAFVVESLEHAQKRGAKILAELKGAGMASDAYHLTSTHPEGRGAIMAMSNALNDAGLKPEQIQLVNAHATSTSQGDISEMKGIKSVFTNNDQLKVTANKSITGHLLGAAGAIEGIASVKSIVEQVVPPTINLENPDSNIENIDQVATELLEHPIESVVSNNFGFGGHNASVVFSKFKN